MFDLSITNQYKRDLKLARKRGLDEDILDEIIKLLLARVSRSTTYTLSASPPMLAMKQRSCEVVVNTMSAPEGSAW